MSKGFAAPASGIPLVKPVAPAAKLGFVTRLTPDGTVPAGQLPPTTVVGRQSPGMARGIAPVATRPPAPLVAPFAVKGATDAEPV